MKPGGQATEGADSFRGFTLIELLVTVAIIAVLASLLLSGLTGAKRSSQSAVCKSNLHQQLIAMQLYAADYQHYPYYMVVAESPVFTRWSDYLKPYVTVGRFTALFQCPTYRGSMDSQWTMTAYLSASYGYNASGTDPKGGIREEGVRTGYFDGSFGPTRNLGLGNSVAFGGSLRAIAESKVLYPADMIALGDSRMQVIKDGGMNILEGQPRLFPELRTIQDSFGDYYRYLGQNEPKNNRHGGKMNIGFCDAHVESIPRLKLLSADDTARRRWNNDHEPHRETWPDISR